MGRERAPGPTFQSQVEQSIVTLTLCYNGGHQRPMQFTTAIIRRAELLAGVWTPSFRLLSLAQLPRVTIGGSIAGTRWISQSLQVFDFNKARVQRAVARKRANDLASGPGAPNAVVHVSDVSRLDIIFDAPTSPQFCCTFPMNNDKGSHYNDVLADDEHIVALRYQVRSLSFSNFKRN